MFSDTTEELAQSKLLLLYIIKMFPYNLTKDQLVEYILKNDLLNYFSIQQYLSELVDAGFLDIVEEMYGITEKGNQTLKYFSKKIPSKIKETLEEDFINHEKSKERQTQVVGEYYQKENGQYMANIKLVENEDILFSLYLDVANLEQAQSICQSWEDNTEEIYMDIIKILTQKN